MWDDEPLMEHMAAGQYESFPFDQCTTRKHPCAQKTTRLAATPRLHRALRSRFGHRRCQLPPSDHQRVPGGADAHGVFASEALSRYSSEMNELIAESVVEAVLSSTARQGGPSRNSLRRARPRPSIWRATSRGAMEEKSKGAMEVIRPWLTVSFRSSMTLATPSNCMLLIIFLAAMWSPALLTTSSILRWRHTLRSWL